MLADFPPAAAAIPPLSMALRRQRISLHPAESADLPFLHQLYASFRAEEMAPLPWPASQKLAFLAEQFRLQHLHFTRHHAGGDFWVVRRSDAAGPNAPVGRLYLDRTLPDWLIIDIGLLPDMRGSGLGSALLKWLQRSAAASGTQGISLHVTHQNDAARALYLRHGFTDAGPVTGFHRPMRWHSPAQASVQLNTA